MPVAIFLGHSCVMLADGDKRIIIDPFLTGNEQAGTTPEAVEVSHILVTHGHGDHVGDTVAIAKRTGATVIANFELASIFGREGVAVHPMHIGGGHDFDFGRVKMTMALHGGGYGEEASIYSGPATGFLITIGGKTVYHAGDTGLFYDMKLIGEMNRLDLAFLPIGDNFTMDIDDAVKAVEFLTPRQVVPMHYNTFPVIEADPHQFAEKVSGCQVIILQPGDNFDF